jgi:xanthine dehydrogenase accessory factor
MGLNLTELTTAIANHNRVVRVVIANHQGSTPRETGASMLVWANGQHGTIGGGALEQQAVESARQIQTPTTLKIPLGPNLGQCCGGAVTLVLEPFTAQNLPSASPHFIRQIAGKHDKPLSIRAVQTTARNSGQTAPFIYENGWLSEPIETAPHQLWLYGAGHVGRAIVETLNGLPFDIIWVDTAANRFPTTHTSNATPLIAANLADAARHAPATAHHLVLTYSHTIDLDLCHRILGQPHASLGLIGSATKRARFASRLAALGHSPAAIASIICPIGQRALGKEPKAIALGVAIEMLHLANTNTAKQEATA